MGAHPQRAESARGCSVVPEPAYDIVPFGSEYAVRLRATRQIVGLGTYEQMRRKRLRLALDALSARRPSSPTPLIDATAATQHLREAIAAVEKTVGTDLTLEIVRGCQSKLEHKLKEYRR